MTQLTIEHVTPFARRLVLPMRRFASVNAWILGSRDRQLIVDTGMPGPETAAHWHEAERTGEVRGVEMIVGTHMHRDHVGQVSDLMSRHAARLCMSADEHRAVIAATEAPIADRRAGLQAFLARLGYDPSKAADPIDYSMLAPFPRAFVSLEDGRPVRLAGQDWHVLLGGGHSSRAVCLLAADKSLFLTGDQILPGNGPHITVWAGTPEADPLRDYFFHLDRLRDLPDSLMVLPGHGAPFRGIAAHADTLRQAHKQRLERLLAGIDGAMTCRDLSGLIFSDRVTQRFADLVPGMTLSLANHLWYAGKLRRHTDDGGRYRFERIS